MKILETNLTLTLFADACLSLEPTQFKKKTSKEIFEKNPFLEIKNFLNNQSFIFLNQIHANNGFTITNLKQAEDFPLFTYNGDFLTTNVKKIALGIITADCLPIIALDMKNQSIGIAHAGWKGSVNNIAQELINNMKKSFNSLPENIMIQFGPCAKTCCYEVQSDFLDHLQNEALYPALIRESAASSYKKDQNKIYFDLSQFNKKLLIKSGIDSKNIDLSGQECTMCNDNFISFRKNKTNMRQITVVLLK